MTHFTNRMCTITLVRHGETLSNRNHILQGQLDTQLSDLGKEQARLVALHLASEKFTHIFSSDLLRALDTAKAIVKSNTVSSHDLKQDKRLRERHFGLMEGKPFNELQRLVRELGIPFHQFTPEGAETVQQVTNRAVDFFDDLCKLLLMPQVATNGKSALEENDTFDRKTGPCKSGENLPPFHNHGGEVRANGEGLMKRLSCACTSGTDASPEEVEKDAKGINTSLTKSEKKLERLDVDLKTNSNDFLNLNRLSESHVALEDIDSASKNCNPQKVEIINKLPSVFSSVDTVDKTPEVTESCVDDLGGESNGSAYVDGDECHVLIVSHGLLLRELKRIFLSKYGGKLNGEHAQTADRISPNTGVSRFTLLLSQCGSKIRVKCVNIHVIDDRSHLTHCV